MDWATVRTLEDVRALDASFYDALVEKSLDFHLPACRDTHWEVERKPWEPRTLRLVPNRQVSRAWVAIFRYVFQRVAPADPYRLADQPPVGSTEPPELYVDLPDDDRDASRRVAAAVNVATAVANAVSAEVSAHARREHEELARDLGLDRPKPGFS